MNKMYLWNVLEFKNKVAKLNKVQAQPIIVYYALYFFSSMFVFYPAGLSW